MVLVRLGTTALLLTGCATPAASPSAAPEAVGTTAAQQVNPSGFAALVANNRTFVLNVHVPDEGSIAGTDAAIPFDQLEARAAQLPADRSTPIAVYCRSGRMSADAVDTLARMGYRHLTELRAGMIAWTRDGRPLTRPGP